MFREVEAKDVRIRNIRMLVLLIDFYNELSTFNIVSPIISHPNTKINRLNIQVKAILAFCY